MRIGVNCFLLRAHIGGLKQYFLTLFNELLQHDAENEYVFFWFAHNEEELNRLETERWKVNAILLRDQSEIAEYRHRMDLYFCPFGALYPRPLPLPTVVMLADITGGLLSRFLYGRRPLYSRPALPEFDSDGRSSRDTL